MIKVVFVMYFASGFQVGPVTLEPSFKDTKSCYDYANNHIEYNRKAYEESAQSSLVGFIVKCGIVRQA